MIRTYRDRFYTCYMKGESLIIKSLEKLIRLGKRQNVLPLKRSNHGNDNTAKRYRGSVKTCRGS